MGITPAMTFFFRTSLNSGCVLENCKMTHDVTIFKKEDLSTADNYRPVSFTAICSKILDHFERNFILTPAQHGMGSVVNVHVRLNSFPQYKTWRVTYRTAIRSMLSYWILPKHLSISVWLIIF